MKKCTIESKYYTGDVNNISRRIAFRQNTVQSWQLIVDSQQLLVDSEDGVKFKFNFSIKCVRDPSIRKTNNEGISRN